MYHWTDGDGGALQLRAHRLAMVVVTLIKFPEKNVDFLPFFPFQMGLLKFLFRKKSAAAAPKPPRDLARLLRFRAIAYYSSRAITWIRLVYGEVAVIYHVRRRKSGSSLISNPTPCWLRQRLLVYLYTFWAFAVCLYSHPIVCMAKHEIGPETSTRMLCFPATLIATFMTMTSQTHTHIRTS